MCFEKTDKKIRPFNKGYKLVKKNEKGDYISDMAWFSPSKEPRPPNEWLDEMPYRPDFYFLNDDNLAVGWHIFSAIKQARQWLGNERDGAVIVRVECYGLDEPYGLGIALGKPAGRFQFMKILEEVK